MTEPGVYVPENTLEECLYWQVAIDDAPPTVRDTLGQQACESLVGRTDFHGTDRVLVHSSLALVAAADGGDGHERAALEFNDVVAQGVLQHVSYLRRGRQGVLAWVVGDAEVKSSRQVGLEEALDAAADISSETMPLNRRLQLPLHMPVRHIRLALCAANTYRRSERLHGDAA